MHRESQNYDRPRPTLIKQLLQFCIFAVLLLASVVLAGVAAKTVWVAFMLGWGSIQ